MCMEDIFIYMTDLAGFAVGYHINPILRELRDANTHQFIVIENLPKIEDRPIPLLKSLVKNMYTRKIWF